MAEPVIIFDTTLRDGEQSPGISLDTGEKLEIAEQLARLGVDYLEAGFPVASQGDFEAVEAIAKSVRGPVITGLSRTARADIDRCWEAVQHAERSRIHVFIATSETHMKHKLKMTPDQVKSEAAAAVAHARQYTDDVEFSPEDASRSDFDFMCEVLRVAVDSGATTLNIPDTVGYGIPEEYAARLAKIREVVPGDYVISTHCHDDLGLAVANSLAAVKAGARQVEVAVNGIGERAGNAALEEVVMAIRTRSDYFALPDGTLLDTNVKAEELAKTSRLVSRLTGYPVQYNKAVVGRNAFAHEAGIHQHGILEDASTYEIMDPSAVGQGETQIVLGKHSGRHAFADTLEKMGITIQGDALNAAFARFKELADRKIQLTDADLEAGFPVASQGDFEAVEDSAKSVWGTVITGLSRTARADIDRCWEAVQHAERSRIHVFIATSETHMKHKLKMTPDQVKSEAAAAVAHARQYTDDVEFSPEDASRSDFDFMCEVLRVAVDSGATTLNIPDTVGYGIPEEYAARLAKIREVVPGDYVISTHCHDDLGLAVANSLAAVKAGARQVEVAVNGIGERAGNAALEEVVMAIRTRSDYFALPDGTLLDTNVKAEELAKTSRLVSRLTGYPVQYNKAVVGRNAFAHEAGIHQHGMLEDASTYEIMDPSAVGQGETQIVLGKHSGRHAFADTLEKMGITIQGDALNAAFARFKELADRKIQLTDADLEAIVAEELGGQVGRAFELSSIEFRGSNVGPASSTVVLTRDGEKVEATAEGDGMIDAACQAIKAATGVEGTLTDFNVSSVTGGVDALGDVIIQLESDGVTVSGRGVSTDVVEASARAFLNAVNKVVRITERGEQRERVVGP